MIHYLSRADLHDPFLLQRIYNDLQHYYYWSDDFSEAMYMDLAEAGFICVSTEHEGRLLLLAEIQQAYALLDFNQMRIGKRVAKLMRRGGYELSFNSAFDEVVASIQAAHEECWIRGAYADVMRRLSRGEGFQLFSTELFEVSSKKLVAGEIGYTTSNNVYTSLSGFHNPQHEYNSWGTLQLVLLGQHLQRRGVRFWNLGHPYMEYKIDLGAKVVSRPDFLRLWYDGIAVRSRAAMMQRF